MSDMVSDMAPVDEAPGFAATGRLIVVCGLPGSGKTTLAKTLEAELGAVRMCPDEWMDDLAVNLWDGAFRARVEALQWSLTQELLRRGMTVVIEWGTWARVERDALRAGARALGAAFELRYLDVPVDELWRRVRDRRMEDPPITYADLVQWAEQFEAPTPDELAPATLDQ